MTDLKKQERAAIEAVTRRFSATLENGAALDLATMKRRGPGPAGAKPHLRFDKTATRVLERLEAAAVHLVPDGMTLVLTLTAPIRLPAKTAALIEDQMGTLVNRRSTIHGNQVRIRLLQDQSGRAPKLLGFVHNPGVNPLLLFHMTAELLSGISGRAPQTAAGRWLVLIAPRESASWEAYRYIYSRLRPASPYARMLMVFSDGRVETLTQ